MTGYANQLLPMSLDHFVTHVPGPPLSKDERFAQDVPVEGRARLLVVQHACPERSVFDRLRPSVEGLTTSEVPALNTI